METEPSDRLPDLLAEALELPPEECEGFLAEACGGDVHLRAELRSLINSAAGVRDFLNQPAFIQRGSQFAARDQGELKPGDTLGDCRVIRLLGEGGMGEVYLVEDTRLERQVAVKLLKRRFSDETLLPRFRHERKVLAGLTHPNIARLYSGDVTPDGLPYLVMEYVEGERLDRYCEAHHLTLSERLLLFRKVCAAVTYAHQNLVVHRDLKPANIRVTPDGEPKLLDFGIAKLLDPDAARLQGDATVTAFGALTPQYASPEHLRGDAITTASDVYSLGVILYELLTGQRLYASKNRRPDELIRAICEQEPARPSTVVDRRDAVASEDTQVCGESPARLRRRLRGDLDNIVAMALRKEPGRRYASVGQFSEDIHRHLTALPVAARKETLRYVGAKFVTRNKALTIAAALVMLTLLGGIITTVWQGRRADEQRRRADRRFEDVRRLANSLMGEINDSVQTLAGSTSTQELIVARALEYLDHLSQEADSPTLRRDLAAAYERIGNVQGNPYEANLGDTDGALTSYRKAESLLRTLAKVDATTPVEVRMALGRISRALGDIFEVKGDYAEMIRAYRRSLEVFVQLARENPSSPAVIDELARAYGTLGDGLERTENFHDEQLRCFEQSSNYLQELVKQAPGNTKYRRGAAVMLMKLGEAYLPDKTRAVDNVNLAVASFKALSEEQPDNVRARRDYALSLYTLGWTLGETGDRTGSLLNHRKAVAIREKIAAADSKDEQARYDLAVARSNLADALTKMDQSEQALVYASRAVEDLEPMMVADPNNTAYTRNCGLFCINVGNAHAALAVRESLDVTIRLAHWADARASYEKAQRLFSELSAKGALRATDSGVPASLQVKIAACEAEIVKLRK